MCIRDSRKAAMGKPKSCVHAKTATIAPDVVADVGQGEEKRGRYLTRGRCRPHHSAGRLRGNAGAPYAF
eukprot:2524299-Pyramimonas_sp.AAC.1